MFIDVTTKEISLNIKPEDYIFIYKLDDSDKHLKDYLIVLMDSLLTFKLKRNGDFSTSVIDFFLFKETIQKQNVKFNINLSNKCMEVCKEYLRQKKEVFDAKNGVLNGNIITDLKNTPYEDQKSAVAFTLLRKRAGNFCSVGIGKTLSSLCYFNIIKNQGNIVDGLILCLNENKFTWARELEKHTNYTYRIVGNGTKTVLSDLDEFKEDLLVVHYDCLVNDLVRSKIIDLGFNFVIHDESHIFRNVDTKRSKAVFEINNALKPKYATFLTGTPVSESPMNAYPIIKLISPNLLPSAARFENHFCNTILIPKRRGSKQKIKILNKKNPYKNLDQLSYLMDLFGFRKTHEDVKGFPETVVSVKELELEPDQKKLYERIKDETFSQIAKLPNKGLNLQEVIVKTLRLRQCLVSPELLGESESSVKLKFLDKLLEEILSDSNSKVVIWSSFRDALDLIVKRYKKNYGAVLYAGIGKGLTEEIRNANEKKFLSDPKCRIICSITNLGTGKNWGHARTAIYLNEPLSRLQIIQSRGRITRRDSKGTSTIIILNVKDTIETGWQRELLDSKEGMSNQIISPDQKLVKKDLLLKGL